MTEHRYVPDLPDLIDPAEYDAHPGGRLVRVRITTTADGVTILGDAFRPELLERILAAVAGDDGDVDQMLCG
ncbi:radical SAM-modified peptide, FtsH ternary system-associated [Dactylosporangium siamense]|uniref:Uncharacterized protein n=1 Tax=Dactylosporangium siamense TaxID=685454 RepID=A0A919UGT2_9ACTN|nr:radical SAM-modified peptide, FtsH ternary system-associated [Dactylosporangium siamense]GIG50008.1 hypothetical protein Dsi01nite_080490 [Dactylosporangium siamense]